MDTTNTTILIIVAVVIVIILVVYIYRQEISLNFKGWGIQAKLHARGNPEVTKNTPASGMKPAATGERSVSIGGNADGSIIVAGDDNKTG